MDQAARLLIVIVNYRTAALTIECLRSLIDEVTTTPGVTVVVVDNASGDGSADQICAAVRSGGWQHGIEVISLERNGGFASGNNAAVRRVAMEADLPDYVMLLNPDTLVQPGAIKVLLEFMEAHPEAGIVGSRIENLDGTARRSAFRFPGILAELEGTLRLGPITRLLQRFKVAPEAPQDACPVEWVSGAAMIVRSEVFDAVGLMDEGYFLYYEELDFCLRAYRRGYRCYYVPASRVVHLVGQSTGVTGNDAGRRRRPAYWFQSRARYFRKNHGRFYLWLANLAWLLGMAGWRLRLMLVRRPNPDPPCLLRDFFLYSFR